MHIATEIRATVFSQRRATSFFVLILRVRLSGQPAVDYARTCLLTSGGDVDVPAVLYDIKTSASSDERFLALHTGGPWNRQTAR